MRSSIKGIIISIILIIVFFSIYKKTRFCYYDPIFVPYSYKINADNLLLQVGDTYKLRPQAINKRVSYKSSNIRVVDVFPSGKVWARSVGTAIITVEFTDRKTYCKVTVIDINYRKLNLQVGANATLTIKGTSKAVTWKCNSKHVTVSNKGLVTACSAGRATITAQVGEKRLECNVYVKNNK